MVTVPAFVWRGGLFRRAVILGFGIGLPLAALSWIDSGLLLSGIIVLIVTGALNFVLGPLVNGTLNLIFSAFGLA